MPSARQGLLLVVCKSSGGREYADLRFMGADMIALGLHATVTMILSIVYFAKRRKPIAYLISFFMIGIIGFGACYAGGSAM